jgi:hypothetical protein
MCSRYCWRLARRSWEAARGITTHHLVKKSELVSFQNWLLKNFKSLVKMEGSAIENIFKSNVMSSNLGMTADMNNNFQANLIWLNVPF